MIPLTSFRNKKIAVFGLGRSNLSAIEALNFSGAKVIAYDDNTENRKRAKKRNIFIQDLREIDWSKIDSFLLSPGVALHYPASHWSVMCARAHNVEIIGDIELFLRERDAFLKKNQLSEFDCPFVAITGTNGKSTTTDLTNYLLKKTNFDVQMGGNIGIPILSLEPFVKNRIYVIECSSFQIDLTPSFHPTIGVLLNITPDHIDRHGSYKIYEKVKSRVIFEACESIIALDDKNTEKIAEEFFEKNLKNKKLTKLSTFKELDDGYFLSDKKLCSKSAEIGLKKQYATLANIFSLQGRHNAQNALAALAVFNILTNWQKKTQNSLQKIFNEYQSLPHRMEFVGRKGKITFINDSKATNAQSSAAALESFENIYWIAGGVAKEEGIEPLKPFFSKIKKAYLIGESQNLFAKTIEDKIPFCFSETLRDAVFLAYEDSKKNESLESVILLSPSCASYDMFSDYEERGEAFKKVVFQIIENCQ